MKKLLITLAIFLFLSATSCFCQSLVFDFFKEYPTWLNSVYGGLLYATSVDSGTLENGRLANSSSLYLGAVTQWEIGPGTLNAQVFGYPHQFNSSIFYRVKIGETAVQAGQLVGTPGLWFRPHPVSDARHFLPPSLSAINPLAGLGINANNNWLSASWHYGGTDSSVFDAGLKCNLLGTTFKAGGWWASRGTFEGTVFRATAASGLFDVTLLSKNRTYTETAIFTVAGINPYVFSIYGDHLRPQMWEIGATKTILGCSWSKWIGATIGPAYNWCPEGGSFACYLQLFWYRHPKN